jgi:hypothetical protein
MSMCLHLGTRTRVFPRVEGPCRTAVRFQIGTLDGRPGGCARTEDILFASARGLGAASAPGHTLKFNSPSKPFPIRFLSMSLTQCARARS